MTGRHQAVQPGHGRSRLDAAIGGGRLSRLLLRDQDRASHEEKRSRR